MAFSGVYGCVEGRRGGDRRTSSSPGEGAGIGRGPKHGGSRLVRRVERAAGRGSLCRSQSRAVERWTSRDYPVPLHALEDGQTAFCSMCHKEGGHMPNRSAGTPQAETSSLARSLLYEALRQAPAPYVPAPRSPNVQGKGGRPVIWTIETIRAAIQAYVRLYGTVPGARAFRAASRNGLPARASVQKYWRTLSDAVRDAGFVPVPSRRKPPPRRRKPRRRS